MIAAKKLVASVVNRQPTEEVIEFTAQQLTDIRSSPEGIEGMRYSSPLPPSIHTQDSEYKDINQCVPYPIAITVALLRRHDCVP
jgi:hypothetical protein